MSMRVWLSLLACLAGTTILPMAVRAQTPPPGVWKYENVNGPARVFAVADLVVPVPGLPAERQVPCAVPAGPCVPPDVFMCDPNLPHTEATCAERLLRLITGTCSPATWQENGGTGTIDYVPTANALVVRQAPAVQEQVAELIESVRRLQDTQVSIEVRLVEVSEDFFERIGVDFDANAQGTPPPEVGTGRRILTNEQARALLEAVQGDRRANVMQAPRITTLNGQSASVCTGEQKNYVTGMDLTTVNGQQVFIPKHEFIQTGVTIKLKPEVSADKRFVALEFQSEICKVGEHVPLFPVTTMITPVFEGGVQGQPVPFTQFIQQPQKEVIQIDTKACVPDGGTVLLGGYKTVRETRHECAPPVLSRIPYVNRLFKHVVHGRENVSLMVMVTPRVICVEEGETKTATAACTQAADCCRTAATPKAPCCAAATCPTTCAVPTAKPVCCSDAKPACCATAPASACCTAVKVQTTPTGSFLLGQGVNCDAGLSGTVVLNERNFALATPAVAPLPSCCPPVQAARVEAPVCCPPQCCPLTGGQLFVARAPVPPKPVTCALSQVAPGVVTFMPTVRVVPPAARPVPPPTVRVAGTVATAPTCDVAVAATPAKDKRLAFYLEAYQKACAAGLTDVAREMAGRCLELDPTCFSK